MDITCGSDVSCLNMDSFLGYHSITNESQLKDLISTTVKVFNLLLSFMSDSCYSTVSKENRLMIFLIKIKLGISYSAIEVFFNVNRTNELRVFYSVLNSLVSKTKHFIFWPNKKSILDNLPR
uniref:Transposase Helix-turn-helix domain-containing protein n=1 Tax=Schizaphis graminum TaxID=13262 RepID=A0A2S2PKT1_SCHGA